MRIEANRVVEGLVRGPVAKSSVPISFLGELDVNTGQIDNPLSELHGRTLSATILVFPEARGSTVGPYVLYGARKRGVAPLGIVVERADAIVASAAVLADIPCVAGVEIENLLDGEEIILNAREGYVEIPNVKENQVVTAFLENRKGEILILKRSEKVGTFPGLWAGVSGYMEELSPIERAYAEIAEEVGIVRDSLTLRREGPLVYVREAAQGYVVHPFLFHTKHEDPHLDWEHTEFAWIAPEELRKYPTVPALNKVWSVLSRRG